MHKFASCLLLFVPALAFAQPTPPPAPPAPPAPVVVNEEVVETHDGDDADNDDGDDDGDKHGRGLHAGEHRGRHHGKRMRRVTVIETNGDEAPSEIDILRHTRPAGFSIGIGVGWALAPMGNTQTDLTVLNTTSVRARFASGVQFEAMLRAAADSDKIDDGNDKSTDRQSEFALGAQLLVPVMRRPKTDLHAVGLAQLHTNKVNPDGDGNSTTMSGIGLGYGVEVQYWARKHVSLSMQASNLLLATDKTTTEQGNGLEIKVTESTYGIIWDPAVRLMFHLYF
ncbi:MAG: outer membrane beta-barrel protein [Myxococcales bacterium]|nr:outer membrane beta-barrel protein [Myxococcales bacterium]